METPSPWEPEPQPQPVPQGFPPRPPPRQQQLHHGLQQPPLLSLLYPSLPLVALTNVHKAVFTKWKSSIGLQNLTPVLKQSQPSWGKTNYDNTGMYDVLFSLNVPARTHTQPPRLSRSKTEANLLNGIDQAYKLDRLTWTVPISNDKNPATRKQRTKVIKEKRKREQDLVGIAGTKFAQKRQADSKKLS